MMFFNRIKNKIIKSSDFSSSYSDIRKYIDIDKYCSEKKVKYRSKRVIFAIAFSCVAVFAFCISIIVLRSQIKPSGSTHFNIYYQTYDELIYSMNEYQNNHKEDEKFMFNIPYNYGFSSTYGIKGDCTCNSERHTEGDYCPNFFNREPFYRINGESDCYVYFLNKITFDSSSLAWKKMTGGENAYVLYDKNGSYTVKVQCLDTFSKKDILLNDIMLIVQGIK